jgi:hypothetical protein
MATISYDLKKRPQKVAMRQTPGYQTRSLFLAMDKR